MPLVDFKELMTDAEKKDMLLDILSVGILILFLRLKMQQKQQSHL
jgi:hypothetical protein